MWFEENRERFEEESALLTQRGFVLDAMHLAEQRIVRFDGHSRVDPARKLQLTFPETFPSFPPAVQDTDEHDLLLRHHSANDRQFCLFGQAKARWSATSRAVAALDEADELIADFRAAAAIPPSDDVPEPPSALLRYDPTVSIFVPPPISLLDGLSDQASAGNFHLFMGESADAFRRGVVVRATLGSRTIDAAAPYRSLCGDHSKKIEGRLMYMPETLTAKAINDLATRHFNEFDPRKLRANLFLGIAFPEQSGNSRNLRLAWVFAVTASRNTLQLVRGFPYAQEERAARIPGLAGLNAFRVAVVGCGCLGSKIAVALAASGVEKFTLIDQDIVEPYNSVRSELGVPLFGLPKPIGLRLRILEANPAAYGQFVEIRHSIGATNPLSSEQHLVEHIAGADLVIDATGSHGVNRWLNQLACEKRIAAIYVSVTNGAWSGEIVRVKPLDPCWACWNAQYENDLPPGSAADPIYPPGCDQPSFTGTTFDTGIVANLASVVAMQTLLGEKFPLPPYPQPYLRWLGRDAFGAPVLRADTLPIHRRPNCPSCNGW